MTKEQAKKEVLSIIDEYLEKCDLIREEAEKNGTLMMGLDSNKELFKEVEEEAQEKLRLLTPKIDKE